MANHQIINSISVLIGNNTKSFSVGDLVKVDNPDHEDHGALGEIVWFDVLINQNWNEGEDEPQGIVLPMVALNKKMDSPTIFGIPLEKLTTPSPLEKLAIAGN